MATELAKAYVQIVPSAEGIKGSISKVLGGEAKSAGESSGTMLGGKLVGALKTVIAAAGVGKLFTEALNAGGDLQQSFGGLETLYGEAADAAKNYAMRAAEAGISANDYAEQAVSFGAALKSAFKGDVAKAAEAANTAILDMADNSAKMGTDIASIQTAYQGFAKQNYTMLDNLKLGYGGTKSEMERLLKDAEKLSGVKYNIDNLGDVYDAIHVIQTDLGLTGVAADEAATTFSGSFGAMKAAAQNTLAALTTGENMYQPIQKLMKAAETFVIGNLIPMSSNIISAMPQVINNIVWEIGELLTKAAENTDGIVNMAANMIGDFVAGMGENIPYVITGAIELAAALARSIANYDWPGMATETIRYIKISLDEFAENVLGTDEGIVEAVKKAIVDKLPEVLEKGAEIVKTIVKGITNKLPDVLSTGIKVLRTVANGVLNSLPDIASAAGQVCSRFLQTIASNLPSILSKGFEIIGKLVAGIIEKIPDVVATVPKIFSNFAEGFKGVDWESLGKNIINGLVNGIKSGASSIIEAAKGAAQSAFDAAKEKLGIHSPSRVFRDKVGFMISAGIAEGITDGRSTVEKALNNVTGNIGYSFGSGTESVNGYRYNTYNGAGGYTQVINVNQQISTADELARKIRTESRYGLMGGVNIG